MCFKYYLIQGEDKVLGLATATTNDEVKNLEERLKPVRAALREVNLNEYINAKNTIDSQQPRDYEMAVSECL